MHGVLCTCACVQRSKMYCLLHYYVIFNSAKIHGDFNVYIFYVYAVLLDCSVKQIFFWHNCRFCLVVKYCNRME